MNRIGQGSRPGSRWRMVAAALLLAAVLGMTAGLSCENIPFASATFRDAALGEISSGVKSIVNGILDGIFAVIEEAGTAGSNST